MFHLKQQNCSPPEPGNTCRERRKSSVSAAGGEPWKSEAGCVISGFPTGLLHDFGKATQGVETRAYPHDSTVILAWEWVLQIGELLPKNWKIKADVSFDIRSGRELGKANMQKGKYSFWFKPAKDPTIEVGGLLNWCFYKWTRLYILDSLLPNVLICFGGCLEKHFFSLRHS